LINNEGEAVISVINDYARSWSLLQGYDEQSIKNINCVFLKDMLKKLGLFNYKLDSTMNNLTQRLVA